MSNYRITQFSNTNGTVKWNMTANENIFQHSVNQSTRHFISFLCQNTYRVSKVKRLVDNVEFELGRLIKRSPTGVAIVLTQIELNTDNGKILLNGSIALENAISAAGVAVQQTTTPTPAPIPTLPAQTNDEWFLALQNRIIANYPRAIRLEKTLRNRKTQTLKDFIKIFFEEWNGNNDNNSEQGDFKNTIYVDNHSIQTGWGKRRSIGDLFMICRYYFPNCTLKQVYQILLIDLYNEFENGFRTSKCNTIGKRVWYYDNEDDKGQLDLNTPDEYNNTISIYLQKLA
jgi:hypothetical protein